MLRTPHHASITQGLRSRPTLKLTRSKNLLPVYNNININSVNNNNLGSRKRSLWTESLLLPLKEGFLDLAIALPWPTSFPPYASTIILTTVLSRLVFTLPFSIWAKKRQWRLEEEVIPELKTFRNEEAVRIAQEMKYAGYAKQGLEVFKEEHLRRLQLAMDKKRKELFKTHSCSPTLTMVLPAITQLPLFIFSTALFSSIATRPTPLDDESFLTLTSLAKSDPTGTLPVALGLTTLANVETAGWLTSAERAARNKELEERQEEEDKKKREEGKVVAPRMKNIVQTTLRGFSIVRIVVGLMVDGSVIVYWLSSATFGLLQSWAFNWWDARRSLALKQNSGAIGKESPATATQSVASSSKSSGKRAGTHSTSSTKKKKSKSK